MPASRRQDPPGLSGVFAGRAAAEPDRLAFEFLDAEGRLRERWSYRETDRRARRAAGLLREAGAAGRPVLLLLPPGPEFTEGFLGCLYAGSPAVPLRVPAPARLERSAPLLEEVALRAAPAAALMESRYAARWREFAASRPRLAAMTPLSLEDGRSSRWLAEPPDPASPAVIQFTSGSTGLPRGVVLSHGNILRNQELIRLAMGNTPSTHGVHWLPPYHDMGLFGALVQPPFAGCPSRLAPASAFTARPELWMEACSGLRDCTTGAPNFAFEWAARALSPAELKRLRLGGVRVLYSGGDPVRAETFDRFLKAYGPAGLRREALFPTYGLAEATLIVSGGPWGSPPLVARFRRDALQEGRLVQETRGGPGAIRLVGCGRPLPGLRVRIVDPKTLRPAAEGRTGEVWVSGPTVAEAYAGRPEETRAVLHARLSGEEGRWLRTGDLGFLFQGQVFISGRRSDLIEVRGRQIHPEHLEWSILFHDTSIRATGGAAFSVEDGGRERLILVAEASRQALRDPERREALTSHIRGTLCSEHSFEPDEIVLVHPGALPRTTSGKVRRAEARARYLAGEWTAQQPRSRATRSFPSEGT